MLRGSGRGQGEIEERMLERRFVADVADETPTRPGDWLFRADCQRHLTERFTASNYLQYKTHFCKRYFQHKCGILVFLLPLV